MKDVKVICDRCKLEILSGETMMTLSYTGLLAHNQFPLSGWHFHYNCFTLVVNAILETFKLDV